MFYRNTMQYNINSSNTLFSMSFHRLWNCDTPIVVVVVVVVVDATVVGVVKTNLLCISIHENVSFCFAFEKPKQAKLSLNEWSKSRFGTIFIVGVFHRWVTWNMHHAVCHLILVVKTQRLANNERNKKKPWIR